MTFAGAGVERLTAPQKGDTKLPIRNVDQWLDPKQTELNERKKKNLIARAL
jgi:hypothetical protein